ncbi:hypothetical protein FA15DRAFT_673843 [Coprinopsis marcescibilis]|uniref:Uncharacterized protein n=1 Tax=Coprinopsis marcescibilis TaxID=230819 RepID=A0A5C3KJG1_COPMA|nr:hypothetical protein FA15DRAFT_673843 [Coprinopsis marcescibilis]
MIQRPPRCDSNDVSSIYPKVSSVMAACENHSRSGRILTFLGLGDGLPNRKISNCISAANDMDNCSLWLPLSLVEKSSLPRRLRVLLWSSLGLPDLQSQFY